MRPVMNECATRMFTAHRKVDIANSSHVYHCHTYSLQSLGADAGLVRVLFSFSSVRLPRWQERG